MAENNLVPILWLLFSLLFSILSAKSFKESKKGLRHLQPKVSGKIVALGVDFESFLREFRDFYRKTQLAALTSLASFALSLGN